MKYICLGYLEPGKFEGMSEAERRATFDEWRVPHLSRFSKGGIPQLSRPWSLTSPEYLELSGGWPR